MFEEYLFHSFANSAQKQFFADKFHDQVLGMHCFSYEYEISREKLFAAILWLLKSMKIFNLEILGYMAVFLSLFPYN